MIDLERLETQALRELLGRAREELERREREPLDEHTVFKSLALDFKRHRRRRDERFDFDPFG